MFTIWGEPPPQSCSDVKLTAGGGTSCVSGPISTAKCADELPRNIPSCTETMLAGAPAPAHYHYGYPDELDDRRFTQTACPRLPASCPTTHPPTDRPTSPGQGGDGAQRRGEHGGWPVIPAPGPEHQVNGWSSGGEVSFTSMSMCVASTWATMTPYEPMG